jgi:N-hydroxyarylamine O-acetyltransferase
VNVEAYLDRIGYAGAAEPTYAVLAELQRAHMLTVPFENLDIALGRRLVLDRRANYAKIVERRRGGWCFELNGLFAWLLEQLGYRVTLLGSRVDGERGAGQQLAHLLLRVDLDRPYLCDVGFGEGSLEPVPLEQVADGVMRHRSGLSVVFTNSPRRLEDFQGMCDHLQTSSESGFVRTRVCTVALPDGRLRLRELVLTERHGEQVSERELAGEREWRDCLLERFGVALI